MSAAEDKIIADLLPWIRAEVEQDFGSSASGWIAAKLIKKFGLVEYFTRKVVRNQVARYGHKIGSALEVVLPRPDLIFNERFTSVINDVKELCGEDVADFGPVAVDARKDSGPAPHFG